jgi:chloride channel protein, CIC family
MSFDTFLCLPDHNRRIRHVVVTDGNRIVGVLRVNTALRQGSEGPRSGVPLRDIASRNFTIVREDDIVFDVIRRIWRKRSMMALVIHGRGAARPGNVVGVITKEHVADSVAASVIVYPASA